MISCNTWIILGKRFRKIKKSMCKITKLKWLQVYQKSLWIKLYQQFLLVIFKADMLLECFLFVISKLLLIIASKTSDDILLTSTLHQWDLFMCQAGVIDSGYWSFSIEIISGSALRLMYKTPSKRKINANHLLFDLCLITGIFPHRSSLNGYVSIASSSIKHFFINSCSFIHSEYYKKRRENKK